MTENCFSRTTCCQQETRRNLLGTMGLGNSCGFLALPREIRNLIYDSLTGTIDISPPERKEDRYSVSTTGLVLCDFMVPAMLRVNKQIYTEYREQLLPQQAHLVVKPGVRANMRTLPLKSGVPNEVLRAIQKCYIVVGWTALENTTDIRSLGDWCSQFRAGIYEGWTPTKGT